MSKTIIALSLLMLSTTSFNAFAVDAEVQRQLDAQQRGMLTMQNQIETLNQQIATLRGDIEKLQYDLKRVQEQASTPAPAPAPSNNGVATNTGGTVANNASNQAQNSSGNGGGDLSVANTLKEADATAKGIYDKAYALVVANNLGEAEESFKSYVQAYPDNSLTPNAWYWLAQVQYTQKKLDEARVSFLNVARFTSTPKRPDALYKLGLISKLKGDNARAKQYFDLVIKTYPADTAATMANKELQSL